MKEIKTEIIINASSEAVWNVLTNYEAYPSWNPFIVSIEGDKHVGGRLRNTMHVNSRDQVFKPHIEKFDNNHHFEWLGKLPLGMFTGRHYFILEAISPTQTKLIHGEHFGGWLRGIIMNKIGEETQQNFIKMNRALKAEVERVVAA